VAFILLVFIGAIAKTIHDVALIETCHLAFGQLPLLFFFPLAQQIDQGLICDRHFSGCHWSSGAQK
jgi:hypothetical protein